MDEKQLIKEYQDYRSETAFGLLYEQNKKMIEKIAKHYCFDDYSFLDDLIVEGAIGLQKAILKYDLSQDTPLNVYAKKYVEGEIVNASNTNRFSGVPKYIQERYFKIRKVESELEAELGCKPTLEDIAERIGDITPIEVQDVLEVVKGDAIKEVTTTYTSDKIEIGDEDLEELDSIYEKYAHLLRPIEYQVLTLLERYQEDEDHTPYELTKAVLHISENKIRNIECIALRKIRNYIKKQGEQLWARQETRLRC